jgi:undecaprenyl diphosphate synthase
VAGQKAMNAANPRHIAFIMDGNGRWARRRMLPRLKGHERGAAAIRRIVEELCRLEIPEGTFYALSTENFALRPKREVQRLLELLVRYLDQEEPLLMREQIKLAVIGRLGELPAPVVERIQAVVDRTAAHTRFVFRLAVNYGSRQELWDAARALAAQVARGELTEGELASLGADGLRRFLYDPTMTDPDLLVRTGGQSRLSNFLLWQLSYGELYVTDVLWPAFAEKNLHEALAWFRRSTRKFGAVV